MNRNGWRRAANAFHFLNRRCSVREPACAIHIDPESGILRASRTSSDPRASSPSPTTHHLALGSHNSAPPNMSRIPRCPPVRIEQHHIHPLGGQYCFGSAQFHVHVSMWTQLLSGARPRYLHQGHPHKERFFRRRFHQQHTQIHSNSGLDLDSQ